MERHPFDPLSFAFGAIFLAIGLVVVTGGAIDLELGWVGPLVAIGLGLLLLAVAWPRRASAPEGDGTEAGE